MVKSIRFLRQFIWINLSAIFAFAAIVILGCYATGVTRGADNLFKSYFQAFPLMMLFILYIYGFALCTSSLNLALSFGARRRDFFWGIQGSILLYTVVCWLLQMFMSSLPALGNWSQLDRPWVMGSGSVWTGIFPLLCLTALEPDTNYDVIIPAGCWSHGSKESPSSVRFAFHTADCRGNRRE